MSWKRLASRLDPFELPAISHAAWFFSLQLPINNQRDIMLENRDRERSRSLLRSSLTLQLNDILREVKGVETSYADQRRLTAFPRSRRLFGPTKACWLPRKQRLVIPKHSFTDSKTWSCSFVAENDYFDRFSLLGKRSEVPRWGSYGPSLPSNLSVLWDLKSQN